jgi:putative endonuclease
MTARWISRASEPAGCGEARARRRDSRLLVLAASRLADSLALDDWRLRRVVVAAERLAPRYMREGDDVRIDAMFMVPRRWPRHLVNVWQG